MEDNKPATCKMCGKIANNLLEAINHLMDHPEELSTAMQEIITAQQAKKNERLR